MGTFLSRKEQRKIEEQRIFYRNMKKTAAVLGTTVTAVSAMAPLAPIVTVLADEPDSSIQTTDETTENTEIGATETTGESTQATEATQPVTEETTVESIADETKEVMTPFAQSPLARSSSTLTTSNFIATVAQYAANVAQANDLYASVMIAQAIIESGWGQSTLSQAPYYNLFGIKGSYNGQTVYMNTQEYLNGQWVTKSEPFRKYPSFAESFADNAYTLRNVSFQSGVYYYSGAWKSNTNSYRDATAWLTGRYATDPSYASKLNSTIETYGLTRYDTPSTGGSSQEQAPDTNTNVNTNTNNTTTSGQTYTVQSGDSIWAIANKYGISMDDLRNWNNLSGDLIYPGQKLIVSKTVSNTPNTNTNVNTGTSNNTNSSTNSGATTDSQSYTVQSGDSIWAIANKFGISMDDLRNWNNLSGDLIHPGQKLIVSKTASTTPNTNTNVNTNVNTNTNTNTNSNSTTTNSQSYTVQSGDSIWLIANKYGISMADLRSWNNLSSDLIHPGQTLIVSKTASTTPSTPTTPNTNTNQNSSTSNTTTTNTQYHTVQSGDSIWAIANKYGISMTQLRSWNNLSGDLIHPNQKLIVKQGTSSTVTTLATPSASSTNQATTSSTHTVKSGDSLWALAQTYKVSIQQIKTLNALSSDTIYIGQSLKVI